VGSVLEEKTGWTSGVIKEDPTDSAQMFALYPVDGGAVGRGECGCSHLGVFTR
jgi:hypothetical protein